MTSNPSHVFVSRVEALLVMVNELGDEDFERSIATLFASVGNVVTDPKSEALNTITLALRTLRKETR